MDHPSIQKLLTKAEDLGCSYAEVRYQVKNSEVIEIDNKVLNSYRSDTMTGLGVRVVYGGSIGYASTTQLAMKNIEKTIENAVKAARAIITPIEDPFSTVNLNKADYSLSVKDPFSISPEEKVSVTMDANTAAYTDASIQSSLTRFGMVSNFTHIENNEGTEVKVHTPLIGIAQVSVAKHEAHIESVASSESMCAGYEFIDRMDWNQFSTEISHLAIKAVKARPAPQGTYPVVMEPLVVGLVLHEALGHACEADGIVSGDSILKDKLGKKIADDKITIIDNGLVKGGYSHPFDDEGVEKESTVIVKDGILVGYLTDRWTAKKLEINPTGNSRAQNFEHTPLVRQTNYYMESGECSIEELVEDIDEGVFVRARGTRGGQVNPGMGTFTFGVGPSHMIKNGEVTEMVKGVVISGSVLDTLKTVDGVTREVKVKTSVFGGCGKGGQLVKTGMGGPHIRVRKMVIGGRS